MSPVIAEEIVFLLRSVECGVLLRAAYEVVRRITDLLFRSAWWRGLEDLLYWTVCSVVFFAMIWEENGGTIRWYALAGAVTGAGMYHCGIRPLIYKVLKPLWIFIRKILQFVENLLKNR